MLSRILRLLPIAGVVLLAGCLELSQEIWINPDGSGRIRFDFGISEFIIDMARSDTTADPIQEFRDSVKGQESAPGVRSVALEDYREEGLQHFVIDMEVDDVTQLDEHMAEFGQTMGSESTELPSGMGAGNQLSVERMENGNFLFRAGLQDALAAADQSGDGEFESGMQDALLESMFGDRTMSVTLHAPNIVDTNGELSEGNRTVRWEISMVELMKGDYPLDELRAEVAVSEGWPLYMIVGAAVAGLLVLVLGIALARRAA